MKTYFSSNPKNYFWHLIRNLFLGVLFILSSNALNGQTFECGSEFSNDVPIQGAGSCIDNLANLDPKCVKIKFHVINNTSGNTENLPDEILLQLIEKVNLIFGNTKIRFSIGYNCTHRATLTNITSDVIFRELIGDVTPGNFNPNPSLNWDQNAINIFFFQQSIFPSPYRSFRHYPVVYMGEFLSALNTSIAIHELGHALSLNHTFGDGNNGIISNSSGWECKDGSNAATTGDLITDTPADPFTQDINPMDGIFDTPNNCNHNPPNTLKDNCNDDASAWNIPFDNLMSYYNCGTAITPCQSIAMHNRLLEVTNLVMDCNDDLFNYPPCVNIIINQNTTWTNQTLHMCPNQRIIVYPPYTLTIENCTITKGNRPPPNPNCPTLVNNGNWDGIYVGDVSFPISGSISALNYGPGPGNILIINSGSVIEYSNNGIVAGGTYGNVIVQNSTFQHNGRITKVFGSGSINFYNSILNVDAPTPFGTAIQENKIHAISSNVFLGGLTKLENFGSPDKIGINSTNGKVGISGSIIKNFEYSIFKDLGGNLNVFGSKFYGAPLYNKSSSVKVRNSYFETSVKSEGNSIGTYSGNHFKGDLYLSSPQQSNLVKENYFTNCLFALDKNNKLSDAICNRWNNDIAVDAIATALPMSWGTKSIPSGNKWEGPIKPKMYSQVNITNYYKSQDNNHIFDFKNPFNGEPSNQVADVNCQYTVPPSGLGNEGTTGVGNEGQVLNPDTTVNWANLNNEYDELMIAISNLEANLSSTSGEQLLTLQDNIENLKITAGQIVNEALQQITVEGDQYLAGLWYSRAGNISNLYQSILTDIYNSSWSSAISLATISNSDLPEIAGDKFNFILALNYLNSLEDNGTSATNLSETQLSSLIDLCDNSFGDYTATLRTFLNIQYGIIIVAPNSLVQRNKNERSDPGSKQQMDIVIYPNPNHGNFSLVYSSSINPKEITITDLNGIKVFYSNNPQKLIDLPVSITQGIYILYYKLSGDDAILSKKLILIK
ncbi:MAG: zinc-dependent metalloprotease [Bacteroidota bacterium]|nr:zinc-dependent metalloprotease [Bacteroidota bacterium]